jgi:hypothetical protein
LSFSAGYHADAVHNGSFVWTDFRFRELERYGVEPIRRTRGGWPHHVIDEHGVALAAIKALHRENAGLRTDVDQLRARDESKNEELAASRIEVRCLEAA